MCQNGSHPRANFCKCLVGGSLVKERNSRLPVYIQTPETGLTRVSQQRLKDTFPVLFNDGRRSGDRVIDPIGRLSPFFETIYDREECEEAMQLIISTLRRIPCGHPSCSGLAVDPVLEPYLNRLKAANYLGDPLLHDDALQDYFGLMKAFSALQGPRGRDDFPRQPLHGHIHHRGLGLGPRVDPLIRQMALRFTPSIASNGDPEGIFQHILIHHSLLGNDTAVVRSLIEDLRMEEQAALYDFALSVAISTGNNVAHKIVNILDGEFADWEEVLQWLQGMGGLSI